MAAERRVARALCGSVVLACLLFLADVGQGVGAPSAAMGPTLETAGTACSAATRKRRQRALAAFKRQAPKQRKAYFKTHRSPKLRKAFTRKQRAKLKALQRAVAACHARPPLPPAPPAPTPPAPPPAPPTPAPEPELPPQQGAPCAPALAQNEQARQFEASFGMPFFNEGPINPAGVLAPTGHVDALVIPVDFADAPGQEDPAQIAAQITADLGWFAEVSNGRYSVSATVLPSWYRMPAAASSYPQWHSREGGHRLLSDATAAADPNVDFGRHEFVFVLVPPSFPQGGNPAWSVFPDYGVNRDGVELRHATFMTNRSPYVANHEFTHSLGLPDLYLLDESTRIADFTLVGHWDPMSVPNSRHILGWHKWQLRWIDPEQIACLGGPGTLTAHLTPIADPGGVKTVVVPTSASTAYVVEARASAGRESGLCKEGVLVYSVDSQVRNGQGPVRIRRQGEDSPLHNCGLLHAAPFTAGTTYEDDAIRVEVLPPLRSRTFHVLVTRK